MTPPKTVSCLIFPDAASAALLIAQLDAALGFPTTATPPKGEVGPVVHVTHYTEAWTNPTTGADLAVPLDARGMAVLTPSQLAAVVPLPAGYIPVKP
jgi:hypothetical protein